jgi:hypothetical protein
MDKEIEETPIPKLGCANAELSGSSTVNEVNLVPFQTVVKYDMAHWCSWDILDMLEEASGIMKKSQHTLGAAVELETGTIKYRCTLVPKSLTHQHVA